MGGMSSQVSGWTYRSFTWTEDCGDFEQWVQGYRDDGWQLWSGSGTWAEINHRRTFVLAVRRMVDKPWATPPR